MENFQLSSCPKWLLSDTTNSEHGHTRNVFRILGIWHFSYETGDSFDYVVINLEDDEHQPRLYNNNNGRGDIHGVYFSDVELEQGLRELNQYWKDNDDKAIEQSRV